MAQRAPKIDRRIYGQRSYCWRLCPYSTANEASVVPLAERTEHTTTSGRMVMEIRAGHEGVGFMCQDPACSYFTGAATTAMLTYAKTMTITPEGKYVVTVTGIVNPVCSGHYYFEM